MLLERTLAIATMLTLSVLAVFLTSSKSKYPAPVIASYALHIAVAVTMYSARGLWANDAYGYDREARELVAAWSGASSAPPRITLGKEGFTVVLAEIYRVMGHNPVLGLIMNVTICAVTVPVIASAADRLGLSGRKAAWLGAVFPPLVFWGSLLLREAVVWFAIALVARSLVGLSKKTTAADTAWLVLSLFGLLSVRGTAAILVGAAGLLALVLARRRPGPAVMVSILAAILVAGPMAARISGIAAANDLRDINSSRTALTTLAASGFPTVSYNDPVGMLLALPVMIPRVLAGPFPWEWGGINPLFALDGLGWLVLMFWTVRGWRRTDWRTALVLIGPAVAIVLALAVTSGNYGTLQRLRLLSGIMLIPIASAGIGRADTASRDAILGHRRRGGELSGDAETSGMGGEQPRRAAVGQENAQAT